MCPVRFPRQTSDAAPSIGIMTDTAPHFDSPTGSMLALTFEDVRSVADLLVARGLRADAVDLVAAAIETIGDPRGQILLARLHLDCGTRAGAEQAASILSFWRCCHGEDVEGLALMRLALCELRRVYDVDCLDRDVRWTATSSTRRTVGRPQC
jgi:hypothetical protein